ncbi:pentapeptide repeat-containing protein [Streptomyces sp. NPDC046900]|uniref:pentapeptide repeat-containing protein n=1 Tax=Streptomyces sp. NPDC046900 TaxID=3155473 RepID=UPI0033CF63F4
MDGTERGQHAAALRGLLYLACPDAAPTAIAGTAAAIARRAGTVPKGPVPQAASLKNPFPAGFRNPQTLSKADLSDADLSGAILGGALLRGTNLTCANLSGAHLSGANLTGANLTGANLTGTNLIDAHLYSSILNGANLADANLTRADLSSADLTGADLTGALSMRLPPDALWDRETRWPAELAALANEFSEEVAPGVFRVRSDRVPDRLGAHV